MSLNKIKKALVPCILVIHISNAQQTDSTNVDSAKSNFNIATAKWQRTTHKASFPVNSLVVPGIMIAYGFTSLENDPLKDFNEEISEEVFAEHPHKKITIDNYLQFTPAAAVYGLNAMGIKGKHNIRDRSMIYVMANIISNTTVYSLKKMTAVQRPDKSSRTSFPSGHTAEAFVSAEFLYQEYKNVSPWYGIAGYAVAATTGYLRLYNNKHWVSDIVAGAGVGIASTKIAYWLYPKIQRTLFKDKPVTNVVMPFYQNGSFGIGLVHKL
jgi:hypothetical protein